MTEKINTETIPERRNDMITEAERDQLAAERSTGESSEIENVKEEKISDL